MAGKKQKTEQATVTRKQHISRVKAENFMGLEFVEFTPKRGVIKICGRNDQGKSSLITFIRAVLGGKYEFPEKTVRDGSDEAQGEIETQDFQIKWSYRDGDKSPTLTVRDKARGKNIKGPQTFVRRLFGTFALDLLRFYEMEPREQLQYCNRVMVDEDGKPIDLEEYESEKDDLEKDRREKRRARDDAQAVLEKYPPVEDPPAEPVDVTALSEEIEAAIAHNSEIDAAERALEEANERVRALDREVEDLERRLKEAKKNLANAADVANAQEHDLLELERTDVEALKEKRGTAAAINEKHDAHTRHVEARAEYEKWQKAFDACQTAVEKLVEDHRLRMEKAQSPVVGLEWRDGTFHYEGIPLKQNSMRNKIMVAWQLAMAENPDMPIALIDDANVLDDDAKKLFEELSTKHDADTIMVLVGEDVEDAQLTIRDGKAV